VTKTYTLALGFLLASCAQVEAITFAFEADQPLPKASILLEFDGPGLTTFAEGNRPFFEPDIPINDDFTTITTAPNFRRLFFDYEFGNVRVISTLTPDFLFTNPIDINTSSVNLFGDGSINFFHITTFVSIGGDGQFLTDIDLTFSSDNLQFQPQTITGRFVAVPEPAPWMLMIGGLVGLLWRRGSRPESQPSQSLC